MNATRNSKNKHSVDPGSFYLKRVDLYADQVKSLEKSLRTASILRFLSFISAMAWSYLFYQSPVIFWIGLVVALVIFLALVLHYQRLKAKKDLSREFMRINLIELDALKGHFNALPKGGQYASPKHPYNMDIDLFGPNSFFQYLNRSSTRAGRDHLAVLLNSNLISGIKKRQEAVRELSEQVIWRQEFSAHANLLHSDSKPDMIIKWIAAYKPAWHTRLKYLPKIFGSLSLIILVLCILELLPFSALGFWFFLGLGIVGLHFKKIQVIYSQSGEAKALFKQYQVLLKLIEQKGFEADLLKTAQKNIQATDKKASEIVKTFSRVLDAFDQRNNLLMGVVLNGLFLWDVTQCLKIEKWIHSYREQVVSWFDAVALFDAFSSLGNFAFNHSEYVYPQLKAEDEVIAARQLGHPMIKKAQRVANDFNIASGDFHVITGANMAGKSTFLRTVGLAVVMANVGLPVCAVSFAYRPIKLISSMRTVDSLSDDSSYFYAEIKRLKYIVEQLNREPYLVVLDEILKGTNSKDKEIGSKKFLQKLLQTGSTGIIATHDLSLCDLAKESQRVDNKFFDVGIAQDQLKFDYLLRDGICTTMNASFLLKKMDIV